MRNVISEKNGSSTAPVVNMWCAHTVSDSAAIDSVAKHHALVAEQRLAAEHRDDLGDDAEERQRDDVDLGVAEEPEQVLPEDRAAVVGVEDLRTEVPVDVEHQQRRGEDRERQQDQQARHQDVPGEDRHPEHRHAGRAQRDHRGDHVDAAEDRARGRPIARPRIHRSVPAPGEFTAFDSGVYRRPADVRGAARGEEAGHRRERAEQVQPVGEGVQPRERDVGRADLQRQHEVGEREHDRRREEQQHDVPCIVNSWLYCSGERNCRPGRASSMRMSSAITPPTAKKISDVTMYIRPINLWSVVRSMRPSRAPLLNSWTGKGRETIGSGPPGSGEPVVFGSAVVVTCATSLFATRSVSTPRNGCSRPRRPSCAR